jgi:hypothetical protein
LETSWFQDPELAGERMENEGFKLDTPYTLTCPECNGAMFPARKEPFLLFRCHIGHTYVWPVMLQAQQAKIEAAMGNVMVLMKERAELCRQLIDGDEGNKHALEQMLEEALQRTNSVKELLEAPWISHPGGVPVSRDGPSLVADDPSKE